MFVKVSGSIVRTLLSGGKRKYINISIMGNKLRIQTTGAIITEDYVDILETRDLKGFTDATIELGDNVKLLSEREPVNITITESSTKGEVYKADDGIAEIRQGNFAITTACTRSERFDIDRIPKGHNEINTIAFYNLLSLARCTDAVSKVLAVGYSNIDILDGVSYVRYSNISISDKSMLPDLSISNEAIKHLCKNIGTHRSCFLGVYPEKSLLRIDLPNGVICLATISAPSTRTIYGLIDAASKCKHSCSFEIPEEATSLLNVTKVYPKAPIDITVSEEGIGLIFTGAATFRMGVIKPKITIKSSTVILGAILKFLPSGDIEVKVGGNVCSMTSGTKTLLVSALIY